MRPKLNLTGTEPSDAQRIRLFLVDLEDDRLALRPAADEGPGEGQVAAFFEFHGHLPERRCRLPIL